MALLAPTRDLLVYLRTHPDLRARIRARPGATLLHAGSFFRPIWREIAMHKCSRQGQVLIIAYHICEQNSSAAHDLRP